MLNKYVRAFFTTSKKRVWATVGAAVAMLGMVAGVAVAGPQHGGGAGDGDNVVIIGDGDCHHKKCPKPTTTTKTTTTTTTTTKPPTAKCDDIDSAGHGDVKFVSAVCDGLVYLLSVRETGQGAPAPVGNPPVWHLVTVPSMGDPTSVVDATLAVTDDLVHVTVLTSGGNVLENSCKIGNPNTPVVRSDCDTAYTEFPKPPNN